MKFRTARLRPAEGRRIRHPDGRLFAAAGEPVPTAGYYQRLLNDGDLEAVPAPAKGKPRKSPASEEGQSR